MRSVVSSRIARGLARGGGAACFLVLPVLLLGSCMMQSDVQAASDGPSVQEARATFISALDKTEDLIGGAWDNQDDPTARGCELLSGGDGLSYAGLRIGPLQSVGVIASTWEGWGYTVDRTVVGPVIQLIGTNDAGAILILRTSDLATTLQGESECRPVSPDAAALG